jgi:hypothetical protein
MANRAIVFAAILTLAVYAAPSLLTIESTRLAPAALVNVA